MFIVIKVVDRIHIPSHLLGKPTHEAVLNEIDSKYPNRVIIDVGLVICRHGPCLKIGDGICVPGNSTGFPGSGGAHHECLFHLVIFKPFVDEILVGRILSSTSNGLQVTLGGFFQDIHIPPYWMLRISTYNEETGLWVWKEPNYDEDEDEDCEIEDDDDDDEKEDDENGEDNSKNNEATKRASNTNNNVVVKKEPEMQKILKKVAVKKEPVSANVEPEKDEKSDQGTSRENDQEESGEVNEEDGAQDEDEGFEMEIGSEIRFKVKLINFTEVRRTAKGIQAKTTTTASNMGNRNENDSSIKNNKEKGKPSVSFDLAKDDNNINTDSNQQPATMQIAASICEDGLGLTSWWTNQDVDQDGEEYGDEGYDNMEEEYYAEEE